MFKESSFYLEDLLSEIEKAEMSLSPSLSGSCLTTVPPFPRTKAVNSTCPEEAGRAMLSYECPGRCGQKTKFFSRADTVQCFSACQPSWQAASVFASHCEWSH